ncbi:hypothetical protein [Streptomyces chilikensis]|uniref:Uncharacterized protein n=1 Tax=Streptomyces chilikensis TaxID=1194079 RepID=A0ABV3EXY4_9ACTN
MSSELEKAARDAVEAADNTRQVELIAAVLAAQQLLAQQQPAPVPAVTAQSTARWIALGAAGSVAAVSLALSAIAVAVGAVAVTCCLLILRGLWQQHLNQQKEN